MKQFLTRKKNKKSIFKSKWFLILLVVFIFLAVRSAASSYDKKITARKELDEHQALYEELSEKKVHLETQIEALESGRGLEEEFRTRFNVTKEGETMIRIVEGE